MLAALRGSCQTLATLTIIVAQYHKDLSKLTLMMTANNRKDATQCLVGECGRKLRDGFDEVEGCDPALTLITLTT